MAASSTLSFFGATWSSLGRWQFGYEFVGAGSSGNFDLINGAGMYITEKTNANNLHMLATTDEMYIGSTPESGSTDYDYEEIAFATVGLVVSLLNLHYTSIIWSTLGLINTLIPTADSVIDSGSNHVRSWSWYPFEKKVGEFFYFYFDVDVNTTASFEYQYAIFGPTFEALSAGLGSRTLVSGASNSLYSLNPEQMTDEELKQYNIEKIPISQLRTKSKNLRIPQQTVDDLIASGAEYCYHTKTIPEYESTKTIDEKTLDNESFEYVVEKMINRSQIIIDGYSHGNEDWKEYNESVITKHRNKIIEYNLVLEKLNKGNLSEAEMKELFNVYKEEGKGWF